MHQDATWYVGRPQPRQLCVRWGPSPLPKKGRSPQFSAHVYCGQTAGWIKMALGTEVGLRPGDFVLDGGPSYPQKKGQMAGCIKMPLGTQVGLSPGNFVVDGDPAPSPKRGGAPNFRPTSIVAKWLRGSRCTWYGCRPWPTRHCVRWGPSSPHLK